MLAATSVSCSLDPPLVTTPLGWSSAELTRDGVDRFTARLDGATMSVTANSRNHDTNSRMILWPTDAAAVRNHTACVSFTDEGWPSQQGVALRVAAPEDGRVVALTVMKNVWAEATSRVNVLLWDTADPRSPTTIDHYDAADAVTDDGELRPYPWSICARTVGDELTYMMWPSDQPQPSWDDKRAARRMTLPGSVPKDGVTGLYAGHIPAGTTMKLTMLEGFI